MKKVIWRGESRAIPAWGLAEHEKEIVLPDGLAQQFVNQGQASWPPVAQSSKVRKSDDGGE